MQILALNKKNTQLALALLSKEKSTFKINYLKTINLDEEPNSQIKKILSKGNIETASSLSSKQIFLRTITLSLKHKREVKKVLPFQMESLLPGPLDELETQFDIRYKNKQSWITLASCKKEVVARHVLSLEQLDVDVDWVGAEPWNLYCFVKHACENVEHAIVLYVGEEESFFICIIDGILEQSIYVPFGELLQEEKNQKLLIRGLQYCLNHDKIKKIKNYAVFGSQVDLTFFFPQLPLFLEELKIKGAFNKEECSKYAMEIGTALNALDKNPIQFRQDHFLSKTHLKKLKKKLYSLGLIMTMTLAFLFAASKGILLFQLKQIEKEVNAIIDNTYTTKFEKLKLNKISNKLLFKWINQLDELRNIFDKKHPMTHFYKEPRKVAEVLYWISNHLKLQEGLKIESLKYEIVQHPNIDKPYQPFIVKINLVFYTPDPYVARDFHNFLIEKKDPFIDEKKDIVWNREGEKYSFQFFLKNPSSN